MVGEGYVGMRRHVGDEVIHVCFEWGYRFSVECTCMFSVGM